MSHEKKKKRKCHENDEGETTRLNRNAEKIAFVPSTDEHDVDLAEGTLPSSDKTSAASVSYIKDREASDEKTSAASVSKGKHTAASFQLRRHLLQLLLPLHRNGQRTTRTGLTRLHSSTRGLGGSICSCHRAATWYWANMS